MKQTLKIIIGSALVTAGVLKAVPARAEAVPGPVKVSIVHTADLDLSSGIGKRQLEQRLAQAAREVCGTASDVDLQGRNAVRACRVKVLANAHEKGLELAGRSAPIRITASR